jgi:hypothetical protein
VRQAFLEDTRVVHDVSWKLYRLSNPIMGFRFDRRGQVEQHPIYFVLAVPNGAGASLLESNDRGDVVAFGRLPGSTVHNGGARASLAGLGYTLATEELAAS